MEWNGFFWLRIGTSGNNNKPSGSTKCAESEQPRSFSRMNGLCGLSELQQETCSDNSSSSVHTHIPYETVGNTGSAQPQHAPCCIPREKVTDLVEDRAEIFVMDPLGHLRNNFQSPLEEVK
jgi:hypothetical protein